MSSTEEEQTAMAAPAASENGGGVSDTKKKISQFEKASKVKVLSDEEQRKKAKFNAKLGRFENACAVANGSAPAPMPGRKPSMDRKDSTEVLNKAKFFVDVAATSQAKEEQERAEKEAQVRILK